jgi:predicted RNase H-like HicB family nuclease
METPMESLRITVVIEPDDGGFHAYCPAFKGLHIDGETELEALQRTEEALYGYLESLRSHGEPLPIGEHCKIERESAVVAMREQGWMFKLGEATLGQRERSLEALCLR